MIRIITVTVIVLSLFGPIPVGLGQPPTAAVATKLNQILIERLPAYGHRNWIVVADSAYPSQSRAGIETVTVDDAQLAAIETVLQRLAASKHVQAKVYVDDELSFVSDNDAQGIDAYRTQLKQLLGARPVNSLPHEQIINKLDQAAEKFNVLVIKTNLTLPYTSVFFELDCGYWNAEQEARLRDAISRRPARP